MMTNICLNGIIKPISYATPSGFSYLLNNDSIIISSLWDLNLNSLIVVFKFQSYHPDINL